MCINGGSLYQSTYILYMFKLSSTRAYLREDSKSSNSNQSHTQNKVWCFFPNKWVFSADVSALVILKVPACSLGAQLTFSEGESAVLPARCHLGPQQWELWDGEGGWGCEEGGRNGGESTTWIIPPTWVHPDKHVE